jgi:hypothetical protein
MAGADLHSGAESQREQTIMADIDIERKETPIWPWILGGLLLLALLLWLFMGRGGDDDVAPGLVVPADTTAATADTVARTGAIPPAVAEYLTFSRTPDAAQEMGAQHEYTAGGIRRLVAALDALVAQDTIGQTAIEPQLQQLRANADRMQDTPADSPTHSNAARDAFTSAAELMETIRTERYPQDPALQRQVTQAREAATGVQPGEPLLEQRDRVQQFFERAGEALLTIAETPAAGLPRAP